jgi:hypothetical protein
METSFSLAAREPRLTQFTLTGKESIDGDPPERRPTGTSCATRARFAARGERPDPVDVRDDQPEPRRREAQVLADNQWKIVQTEEAQSEQLIALSEQILELTKAIQALTVARSEDTGGGRAP